MLPACRRSLSCRSNLKMLHSQLGSAWPPHTHTHWLPRPSHFPTNNHTKQGLFAPPGDAGFSPLASGLGVPSFAAGSSFQQPWQAAATDKQRRNLRQTNAWRLAAGRQRAGTDGGAAAPAPEGCEGSTAPCHPQPGTVFSSLQWQPVLTAAAASNQQPFSFLASASAPQPAAAQQQQFGEPGGLAQLPVPAVAPHAPQPRQQQQQQLGDAARPASAQRVAARCSSGQEMETDLRSSWGSERSADVMPWQSLQARMREGAAGDAAECRRQASEGPSDAPMRGSAEGAPSVRSSLDGRTPSERQTSQLPLRAAMRSQHWNSHLASPPADADLDGTSPDPLLGRSSGSRKQHSRGSNPVRGWLGVRGREGMSWAGRAVRGPAILVNASVCLHSSKL